MPKRSLRLLGEVESCGLQIASASGAAFNADHQHAGRTLATCATSMKWSSKGGNVLLNGQPFRIKVSSIHLLLSEPYIPVASHDDCAGYDDNGYVTCTSRAFIVTLTYTHQGANYFGFETELDIIHGLWPGGTTMDRYYRRNTSQQQARYCFELIYCNLHSTRTALLKHTL
jgi:hypothetical protein